MAILYAPFDVEYFRFPMSGEAIDVSCNRYRVWGNIASGLYVSVEADLEDEDIASLMAYADRYHNDPNRINDEIPPDIRQILDDVYQQLLGAIGEVVEHLRAAGLRLLGTFALKGPSPQLSVRLGPEDRARFGRQLAVLPNLNPVDDVITLRLPFVTGRRELGPYMEIGPTILERAMKSLDAGNSIPRAFQLVGIAEGMARLGAYGQAALLLGMACETALKDLLATDGKVAARLVTESPAPRIEKLLQICETEFSLPLGNVGKTQIRLLSEARNQFAHRTNPETITIEKYKQWRGHTENLLDAVWNRLLVEDE